MPLLLGFPTEDGIKRLLTQPGDVMPRQTGPSSIKREAAPKPFSDLFSDYKLDLRTAYEIAEPWWEATIAARRLLAKDELSAIREAFATRLAGPASHPKVVWIVRNYWLDCADLNRSEAAVYPETLLLQWLIDAGETELVRLLTCMPYWPIGLDENGNWC